MKNLFSILCILIEILFLVLMRRGQKSLNVFKFGTLFSRFPSNGATSVAVKGYNSRGGVGGGGWDLVCTKHCTKYVVFVQNIEEKTTTK